MQRMYQNIPKEGNADNKFLRCSDLQDKNFEVMCSEVTLYKVDLECAGTVKAIPTANASGFITYSSTINVSSKWLDNSGYLITKIGKIGKRTGYHTVQKVGKNKKAIKVGKISEKDDILTVEERPIALIGNKTKRSLVITPQKR